MSSACFTGHRKLNCDKKELFDKLCKVIEDAYISCGCCDFYAGGAIGFDTIAEKAVIHLRDTKKLPIQLHLVLPCQTSEQTKYWTADQKYEFKILLNKAGSVEYTSKNHHPSCMKIRNKRLVECADTLCICYLEDGHKSGTFQTVNMAIDKGLEVVNLAESLNSKT